MDSSKTSQAPSEYALHAVPAEAKQFLIDCVSRGTLAVMFQVSPTTIDRWVRSHGLPIVEVDGIRLFHVHRVREWMTTENLKRCYATTPLSERHRNPFV